MERLTLERAICRVKIVAKNQRWNSKYTKLSPMNEELNKQHEADYIKDAEEHEQIAEWLEELKSYKDIGTLKELKELKENGAFTGLELAKLAIMQKELKKYKDLEEQGLLAILPCKVGTEVYYILGIPNKTPCAIDKCVFKLSDIDKIGESLFLTHKEAEKKLEEMKNGR